MRFKKKPVVIDATRWDGSPKGASPIIGWMLDEHTAARLHWPNPGDQNCPDIQGHAVRHYCPACDYTDERPAIAIDTLEGTITASPGDWIIRGVQGEFYPCKPDIFDATYEPALHEDR